MESDLSGVTRLIEKLGSNIDEIRSRSLSTLFTKISMNLVRMDELPTLRTFPGALMHWINDHNKKSDLLYKALSILSYYTRTHAGVALLKEYECMEFVDQLRSHLLVNEYHVDDFIELIDSIVKALLPPQSARPQSNQYQKASNQQGNNSLATDKTAPLQTQPTKKGQLTFTVLRDCVSEEDEQIFSDRIFQLRYGKKQQQYSTLMDLKTLLQSCKGKHFKLRCQLFQELMRFVEAKVYDWISADIAQLLICDLIEAQQLLIDNRDLVDMQTGSLIPVSKLEISLIIDPSLFNNVYMHNVLKVVSDWLPSLRLEWLLNIKAPWSRTICIKALSRLLPHNVSIKSSPEFQPFIEFLATDSLIRTELVQLFIRCEVALDSFTTLQAYCSTVSLQNHHKQLAWLTSFQADTQAHRLSQLMGLLESHFEGISLAPTQLVRPCINLWLYSCIAVHRSAPAMQFMPRLRTIMTRLAAHPHRSTRIEFYNESLFSVKNNVFMLFGGCKFSKAEVAMEAFSDLSVYGELLKESLNQQQTIHTFLQLTRHLVLNGKSSNGAIWNYTPIFYALTFHHCSQVVAEAQSILARSDKQAKRIIALLNLFSKDDHLRTQASNSLFSENCADFISQYLLPRLAQESKKELKVTEAYLQNYLQTLLNANLEQETRVTAAKQLFQAIKRAQLHSSLLIRFQQINSNIIPFLLKEPIDQILLVCSCDIYCALHERADLSSHLPVSQILKLLQQISNRKSQHMLLEVLYLRCFQSPFSSKRQTCWLMILFPHHHIVPMNIQEAFIATMQISPITAEKQPQALSQQNSSEDQSRRLLTCLLLEDSSAGLSEIETIFSQMVSEDLFKAKGDDCLSRLSSLAQRLIELGYKFSSGSIELGGQICSSLLARNEASQYFLTDGIHLMICLGINPTKQTQALLREDFILPKLKLAALIYKENHFYISSALKNISTLGTDCRLIAIRMFFNSGMRFEDLNEYAQTCLISALIKGCKKTSEPIYNQIQFSSSLSRLVQMASIPSDMLLGPLCVHLVEAKIAVQVACILIEAISLSIHSMEKTKDPALALAWSKLVQMLRKNLNQHSILTASIFSFAARLCGPAPDLILANADFVDIALGRIYACAQTRLNLDGTDDVVVSLMVLNSCFQFTGAYCHLNPASVKYVLSSTNFIESVVRLAELKSIRKSLSCSSALGSLLSVLLSEDQDLFLIRLARHLNATGLLGQFLNNLFNWAIESPSCSLLGSLAWLSLSWHPCRAFFDQPIFAKLYFEPEGLAHLESMLVVSLECKAIYVESNLFLDNLRTLNSSTDAIIAHQMKKKKLKKPFESTQQSLNLQENQSLSHGIHLLSCLFYNSSKQQQISSLVPLSKDVTKKLFQTIEKLYLCGLKNGQFESMLINLSLSSCFGQALATHVAEGSSPMIEDLIRQTLAVRNGVNDSFIRSVSTLQMLVQHESVRGLMFRAHAIDELIDSLHSVIEDKKKEMCLEYWFHVSKLLFSLSAFKDSAIKLISDKRALEIWVRALSQQRCLRVDEKIASTLANLACFKGCKAAFMANKQIHKVLLGMIEEKDSQLRPILLRLFYNLLYKNAPAIKIYKRPEVVSLIKSIQWPLDTIELRDATLQVLETVQTNP